MKPSNGLRSLLNRFAVVVVTLKKEADPDVVYYRGYWKRKKVCLERADGIQPGRWPVLVLFTGYGVIAKDCTGKTDWAGRVTAGDEFLWEWKEVGEKRLLVFVRRVEVVSWLEKWEQEGWAMAGISLSAVAGVLDLEAWVEQTYRHWQTWKYWRKGKKEQQVIAALLLKRLACTLGGLGPVGNRLSFADRFTAAGFAAGGGTVVMATEDPVASGRRGEGRENVADADRRRAFGSAVRPDCRRSASGCHPCPVGGKSSRTAGGGG